MKNKIKEITKEIEIFWERKDFREAKKECIKYFKSFENQLTISEIQALANELCESHKLPLSGNKNEKRNQLKRFIKSPFDWKEIAS
jgi:hypothetical protein